MSKRLRLELYEPTPAVVYSLDRGGRFTHLSRHRCVRFCRHGLVTLRGAPVTGVRAFDDEGLRRLCRLAELRAAYHLNLRALRWMMDLPDQLEHLRREMRFRRGG